MGDSTMVSFPQYGQLKRCSWKSIVSSSVMIFGVRRVKSSETESHNESHPCAYTLSE